MKEYLTVKELSKEFKLGARNIRKVIEQLKENTSTELLHKDKKNQWKVHHILKSRFKPKNNLKPRYYALSVDLCNLYKDSDIHTVMQFVTENVDNPDLEINYTIERKKANGHSHLHCFINCKQRRKIIQSLRLGFSSINYKEVEIYDLEGWKNYIRKDGGKITTLKKEQ